MRLWIIPIVMLILVQLACVPPQDCMGMTSTISGQIVNSVGSPVADATVTVYGKVGELSFPERVTVQTDNNGIFTVDGVFTYECADFFIDVSANGYESVDSAGPYFIWTTYGDLQEDIVITLYQEITRES